MLIKITIQVTKHDMKFSFVNNKLVKESYPISDAV